MDFNRETFEEERLLTPLTDTENMGGLVPVSPLDNVLDDVLVSLPNYLEVSIKIIRIILPNIKSNLKYTN